MDDEEKPGLPKWWTSGKGPLAIGVSASLAAVVMAGLHYKGVPADGFGTLILISLLANVAAVDNATDLQGRRDGFRVAVAVGSCLVAMAAGAVAYRLIPGL